MKLRLDGFAITSIEGAIADSQHTMPGFLRHDADFSRFQAALDAADMTMLGRTTHNAAPNHRKRRRLVVSRQDWGVDPDGLLHGWNPDLLSLNDRLRQLPFEVRRIAVVGGLGVFDRVLEHEGYDTFELTVVMKASLPGGIPVFSGVEHCQQAIERLKKRGLHVAKERWLDEKAGLKLYVMTATTSA